MATANQTILSAASFVDSIAINTHTGFSWGAYNNASLVIDDLKYLNVTTVRDSFATDPSAVPVMDALAAAGVKFDFVTSSDLPASGSAGLTQYVASVDAFLAAHPGSVVALEGLNEANIQSFSYHGSSSLSAAAQFQADLYTAIRGDANLSSVAVYNMTLAYNDASGYAAVGNLAKYADYSNAHAYVATSTPNQYGLDVSLDTASTSAAGKPSVITETGYTTLASTNGLAVDQTVQAKSILNLLVDSYSDGVKKTYLYELLDRDSSASDQDPEAHFGLFNSDGTPKLAATALHNLTTILADDGSGGHMPTASLDYSLSNMPATGNSMVLAKSNGAYDLVVWAEPTLWNDTTETEVSNPTKSVAVHLAAVHQTVVIYDPLTGTVPIAVYHNIQDFNVPVSDHPLIIEIDPPSVTAPPAAGASAVTGTAADIVAELSDLNAAGTVKSITLTDTHVLTVASEATMKYMIANYGAVLSTIKGGYSFAVTIDGGTWKLTTNYDSTGKQTSTDESAYANGVIAYELVTNADGSTAATNFASGVKTQTIVTNADHSKDTYIYGSGGKVSEIDHVDPNGNLTAVTKVAADGTTTVDQYDTAGEITSETVTHTDGSSSTTLFTATGAKSYVFVTNADQSHDNYAYGIAGQTYTSQHQHVDAAGHVTGVWRYHADGSLDYTQSTAADGSVTSTQYNAAGVKTAQSITHPDGAKEFYSYNITGQSYTTEHSSYDAAGGLVLFERFHADGSYALKVTTVNGVTTTDQYDAKGVLTSEVVTSDNGSSSTSTFAGSGAKSQMSVINTDATHDVYLYDVTGQSYTTQHKHYDASGKLTEIVQQHADGTLDYTQVTAGDGTRTGVYYDASGVKTSESIVHTDGSNEYYAFNIKGQAYTTEHSVYDTTGLMTTFERLRADGSDLMKVTKTADGTATTDQYDTAGHVSSETVTHTDGWSSTSTFSAGVLTGKVVTNTDHSQDVYAYGITGQAYANQVQHVDAGGKVTSVIQTHSDGTLAFKETFAADGSTNSLHYDAQGNLASQVQVGTDGARDVYNFNFGSQGTTQHVSYNSSGNVLQTDVTSPDGTHMVTAFKPGQTLQGGNGNDQFVFSSASNTMVFDHGNDQITNFHAGSAAGYDVIEISKSLVADYSHLQFEQSGQDTVIHISGSDSITLSHVTASQLAHNNFVFV
jgi:hypothetical protein